MILFFFFINCYSQEKQKIPNDYIYGSWKFVKYWDWKAVSYDEKQLDSIKSSVLHIGKNKIYFEGLTFIDTCFYTEIQFKSFFDLQYTEPNVFTDRALAIEYSKDELSTIKRIETDCKSGTCYLGILYLKQDTLITNYCGNFTFLWTKIP